MDYQLRCRIDRPKRSTSIRRRYLSKIDQNSLKKPTKSSLNQVEFFFSLNVRLNILLQSQMQIETENPLPRMEELTANPESMINVPQGSIASDVQQVEDLNEIEANSDVVDQQHEIVSEMSNLHVDEVNYTSNAYRHGYFV